MEGLFFLIVEGNSDSDVETLNKPKKGGGCVVRCNPTLAGDGRKKLPNFASPQRALHSPRLRASEPSDPDLLGVPGRCLHRATERRREAGPPQKETTCRAGPFRFHGFWGFLHRRASFAFSQSCVRPEAKGRTTCLTLGNSEPRAETKAPASPTLKRVEPSTVISRASVPKGEQPVSHPRARRRTVASWGSSNNAKKKLGDPPVSFVTALTALHKPATVAWTT